MSYLDHPSMDFLYPDKTAAKYKLDRFEDDIAELGLPEVNRLQSWLNFDLWLKNNETENLDIALLWLTGNKDIEVTLPQILVNELRIAAEQRINNPKGKYIKSQVKAAKEDTLIIATRLIKQCGLTRLEAFEKAAWYYDKKYSRFSPFITTTIEKAYNNWIKKEGLHYIEGFKKHPLSDEEKENFIGEFGKAPRALIGEKD